MLKCKLHFLFLIFAVAGIVSCDHTAVKVRHESELPSVTEVDETAIVDEDLSCVQRAFDQTQSFGTTGYSRTSKDSLNEFPYEQQVYAQVKNTKLMVHVLVGPLKNEVRKIVISGTSLAGVKFSANEKQKAISLLDKKIADLQSQISIECDGKWKEVAFQKKIDLIN
jgi:hypothetical protein